MMHLIKHMFHTSVIPYISLDRYLNPNLYTIPNMQNMRFFCCSVYIQTCMALLQIMDNNVVSDKKAYHSLTLGGTFVVFIIHPMRSDGYIKCWFQLSVSSRCTPNSFCELTGYN